MTLEELVVKITGDTSGLTKSVGEAQSTLSKIGGIASKVGKGVAVGVGALATGVVAGVGALSSMTEASREYRDEQAKLTSAFQSAGLSAEVADQAYTGLYKVLGDSGQATEASQLLSHLARDAEDVSSWTTIATGVVGAFGDSLPVESLIEASNETAKVGEVTGALADALNWVGISEDEFNEKLAQCATEEERTALITETLAGTYEDSAKAFEEANKSLMEYRENQDKLQKVQATVGKSFEGLQVSIMNAFTPAIIDAGKQVAGFIDQLNEGFKEGGISGLIEAGGDVINEIIKGIASKLPELLDYAVQIIMELVNVILTNLPLLVDTVMVGIEQIISSVGEQMPALVETVVDCLLGIVEAIVNNAPMLLNASLNFFMGLAQGLLNAIPQIIERLPQLIAGIVNFINQAIPQIIVTGVQLFTALITALPEIIVTIVAVVPEIIASIISTIVSNLSLIVQAGVDMFTALIGALPQIIATVATAIPAIVTGIITAIMNNLPTIIEGGVTLFVALISALPQIIKSIVGAVPQIISALVKAFLDNKGKIKEAGTNMIKGLGDGILSAKNWILNKVKSLCNSVTGRIKSFFGIASPSKLFKGYGKFLTQGLGIGIEENGKLAVSAVGRVAKDVSNAFNPKLTIPEVDTNIGVDQSKLETAISGAMITPSVKAEPANFAVETDNSVQSTLQHSNADLISTLLQTTRQLITAIENKDTIVTIDDDAIAKSVVRGNNSYKRRTGKPLLA